MPATIPFDGDKYAKQLEKMSNRQLIGELKRQRQRVKGDPLFDGLTTALITVMQSHIRGVRQVREDRSAHR